MTIDPIADIAIDALLAYLLGAIPFGLLLTRAAGLGDIRNVGSGNIGATNVLRTGNRLLAVATLLLDAGKGAIAVVLVHLLSAGNHDVLEPVAGGFAFLGHVYPVYLRFRGGKGVATFLGIALALAWPIGLAACLVWLVAFLLFRISSIGGLAAALAAPLTAMWLGIAELQILFGLTALLIWWKHRANIARIAAGTEPRSGGRKTPEPAVTANPSAE